MVIFLFQPLTFALWHCFLFLTPVFLLCDFSFYIMHSISHIAQFYNHTYFFLHCFFFILLCSSSYFLFLVFIFYVFDVCKFFFFFLWFFKNYLSICLYYPCPYFRAYFFFSLAFGDFLESLALHYTYFYIIASAARTFILCCFYITTSFPHLHCLLFSQFLYVIWIFVFYFLNCLICASVFVFRFFFVYICRCWCDSKSSASYIFKYW
jgi:hypothetical protein